MKLVATSVPMHLFSLLAYRFTPLFLSLQHAPLPGRARSVWSRDPGAGPSCVEGGEDESSPAGSLLGGSLLQRRLLRGAGASRSRGSRYPHVAR